MTNPTLYYCGKCNEDIRDKNQAFCASCGQPRLPVGWPADPLLGREIVGGQYRTCRRLGAGGFGVVYEVETVLGRLRRAMKILYPQWHDNPEVMQRFINEAIILDRLNHPNIARCYAVGFFEETRQPYILLELVEGKSLQSQVEVKNKAPQPMEPRRVVRLGLQLAEALSTAHKLNLLHRDLKPNNILILDADTPDEQTKIIDFGIAKILDMGDSRRTMTITGTPEFMAPEQFNPGVDLDARLDLWQLGAVLYYMLTGFPPYRLPANRSNPIAIHAQQHARFGMLGPAPSELLIALKACPELDTLVSELLSTEPQRRPNSADEVSQRLSEIDNSFKNAGDQRRPRLLELLCAQPSEDSWKTLCSYLATWPTPTELSAATTEAEKLLARWPEELRPTPLGWWRALQQDKAPVYSRLGRTLDLSSRDLSDEDVQALAQMPALAYVTHLNLSHNNIGNIGVMALASSPYLSQLKHLDLSFGEIGSAGAKALSESRGLTSLASLDLSHNSLGKRGVAVLASSVGLGALVELHLQYNHLDAAGAVALASATGLPKLGKLSLRGNRIGSDGVDALAASPLLARLSSLDLRHNELGPRGLSRLLYSPSLLGLRSLCLAENELGPEEILAFATQPHLHKLTELDLSVNPIGPEGAVALATSQPLSQLSSLSLEDAELGDAGAAALAASSYLSRLTRLRLSKNNIGLSGLKVLAATPHFAQLEHLDLNYNMLGTPGAKTLAASPKMPKLSRLEVIGCALGAEGFAALIASPHLTALRSIAADRNQIGAEGARLAAKLPQLSRIQSLSLKVDKLGPDGAHALATSSYTAGLRSLDLSSNFLGDAGLIALVRSTNLSELRELFVEDNNVGLEGAKALAAISHRAGLYALSLAHNQLGAQGAEVLASSPNLSRLTSLNVEDNQLGDEGARLLAESPNLAGLSSLNASFNQIIEDPSDLRALTEKKIQLLEQSFAAIAPQGELLVQRFYQELFARYPNVKPMFAKVKMTQQRQHLLTALAFAINHLRNAESLVTALIALGTRHSGYGVFPSHYYAVTSTLLDTISHLAGPLWTDELHETWDEALQAIAGIMMNAPRIAVGPEKAEAAE